MSSSAETEDDASDRRRICLIGTGGTIGILVRDRLDLVNYAISGERIGAEALLARVPEVKSFADVTAIDKARVANLSPAEWPALAAKLSGWLTDGAYDGAVIAHGTNLLDELAYFLHLTVATTRPVVLMGAMRPTAGISGDGDLNILNAVRLASSERCVGLGVLVALNDTVHCARDVAKSSTYRLDAFRSRSLGPLGVVDNNGAVALYRRPTRRHTADSEFRVTQQTILPRVDVVLSHARSDGLMIRAAVGAGAAGIVVATSGAAGCTIDEEHAIAEAVQRGLVVVLASRTGTGRVVVTPKIIAGGLVAGDDLVPWKAAVLLGLALAKTGVASEIQRYFDEY